MPGLTALADALAVHAPPEKPINFDWPDAVRVDGGLVGGGRLAWPADAVEDAPPSWLVFSAMIRTVAVGEQEPGLRPLSAALDEEGFELGSDRLIETFARHLMVAVNAWQQDGFAEVANSYLSRLHRKRAFVAISTTTAIFWCDASTRPWSNADQLLPALAKPSWLDPATGGPRL